MNPLENDKVKEFFGCKQLHFKGADCVECLRAASRVLQAMSELIRSGDRCLILSGDGEISEEIASHDWYGCHPNRLAIPSQFQKRPEKGIPAPFCTCDESYAVHKPAPSDPVEFTFTSHGVVHVLNAKQLENLASLVSQAKRQALNENF